MKNFFHFQKPKIRFSVIGIAILCSLLIVAISYSYAFFTISVEKKNALMLIAGNLSYKLSSEQLDSSLKVTVPANTPLSFEVLIDSLNSIESNFQLYYQEPLPSGVKISYVDGSGEPKGSIGSVGSQQKITIVIENNSGNDYIATFGVQGGLVKKDIVLNDSQAAVTEKFALNKEYSYTGNYETFIAPVSGYYYFEATGGAGGGNQVTLIGGSPATTTGYIYLNAQDQIYVYVGGKGSTNGIGGYNGGGNAGTLATGNYGGGGATDFRLVPGTWDSIEGLRSRIMVAAGGGGAASNFQTQIQYIGGAGGTLWGKAGTFNNEDHDAYVASGKPATTMSGGAAGDGAALNPAYIPSSPGSFGKGGAGSKSVNYATTASGAGGGSGYYGGGGGVGWFGNGGQNGAGGSSYISGYAGVDSIDQNGTHTHTTRHYSGKYFVNGVMEETTAYTEDGRAKIVFIGDRPAKKNDKLTQVRYIKACQQAESNLPETGSGFEEIQVIKDGENIAKGKIPTMNFTIEPPYQDTMATDGILNASSAIWPNNRSGKNCITIDLGDVYDVDEIVLWQRFDSQDDVYPYYDRMQLTSLLTVSTDNVNYEMIAMTNGPELPSGYRFSAYQEDNTYTISGLVTWYDMKDRSHYSTELYQNQLFDFSNSNNPATLYNFDYNTTSGWVDNGLRSNGKKEYVRFKNPIQNKNKFTVEIVANIDKNATIYSDLITFDNGYDPSTGDGTDGYALRLEVLDDTNLFWTYLGYFGAGVNASVSYTPNTFVVLSIVIDGDQFWCYGNGKLLKSGTGTSTNLPAEYVNLFIRILDSPYKGPSIIGSIYATRIYDRPLTAEEIAQNYKADINRFGIE